MTGRTLLLLAACTAATLTAWAGAPVSRNAIYPARAAAVHPDGADCHACHERTRTSAAALRANLRFSHKAHLDVACARCHANTVEMPDMRTCLACHAKSRCSVCHLTGKDGRLQVQFRVRTPPLTPPRWMHNAEHTPDFVARHKRIAGDDSAFCAACHTERFCTDCHDGRVRPRNIHPNDWLSMHSVAARKNTPRCASCHTDQSFCLDCHAWTGASQIGPSGRGRALHPAGWSGLGTGRGPGHHAWEAQRNVGACVSCHTERDCAVCHASSPRRGLGIDPHPPGFASRCRTQLARNRRPCLVCHDPNAAELARCN